MFVKAKKYENGETKGRAYTYQTELDVKVGSLVTAEFGKEDAVLKITEIDVARPTYNCKEIKGFAEKDFAEEVTETALEPMGKAIDRLRIESIADLSKMDFDVEVMAKSILAGLPDAENIVVTAENAKDVKMSTLKLFGDTVKQLDEIRKAPKRIFAKLNSEYDAKMRELEGIIDSKGNIIREKVESYYEEVREANIQFARECIKKYSEGLDERFRLFEEKPFYGNVSTSRSAIEKDVKEQAARAKEKQENYRIAKELVEVAIDRENEELVNKLSVEVYDDGIYAAILEMEPPKEVVERVVADARRRRAEEERVREQARLEAEKRAKEEAERKAAEEARLEAERARLEEERARLEEERARIEEEKAEPKAEPKEPESKEEIPEPKEDNSPMRELTCEITGKEASVNSVIEYAKSVGVTIRIMF